MQVRSLGREDPQEEGTATHSSVLAWDSAWTEEHGGLHCMGLDTTGATWRSWYQPLVGEAGLVGLGPLMGRAVSRGDYGVGDGEVLRQPVCRWVGSVPPARVAAWLWVSHHLAPAGHWVGPGFGAKSQGGFTNISVHMAGCSPVRPSLVSMPPG